MTLLVEPVGLAVSLIDARLNARVDGSYLDAELETWVRVFTADAEHETRRAIIDQTHRITLDQFDGAIQLSKSPVQSVIVKFYDVDGIEQTLDPQDYIVSKSEPVRIKPVEGRTWPTTQVRDDAVTVDAVCGYGPDHTTTPAGFRGYILGRISEKYSDKPPSPYLERNLWSLKVWA